MRGRRKVEKKLLSFEVLNVPSEVIINNCENE